MVMPITVTLWHSSAVTVTSIMVTALVQQRHGGDIHHGDSIDSGAVMVTSITVTLWHSGAITVMSIMVTELVQQRHGGGTHRGDSVGTAVPSW